MGPPTKAAPAPPPPSDPAVPVSYPLKTLEELESREYFKSFHFPFNQAAVKLPETSPPPRPRILVCHDMAGGYTDDRFVQGGSNADAYAIWHWYLIDVFVYFSHNLVTLPPPCWTNTAHRHGVKVLGTFIMEGDEGRNLADKLLSTENSARMYAERLTELAVALGFDGWLINMEVELDPVQIPALEGFVSHLSQTMHSALPRSLVIWYDSVTVDGMLIWQNQLNEKNKSFFDRCDGIFVNYSWEEEYCKASADVAGDRRFDVYMGIDVFGRGTFGDGQWTTNVALDVIKKNSISAAIFAPGWVYETQQPPDFQTAQNKWWGLVEKSWGAVQNYPKLLPFYSNFDQGRGYHISVEGVQVLSTSWNNISSQSFQPLVEYPGDSKSQPIQVFTDLKERSYSGGGNIAFRGSLAADDEFTLTLFRTHLLLGNSPLHFTYSVKSKGNSLLGLVLELSSTTTHKTKSILLAPTTNPTFPTNKFTKVVVPHRVTKPETQPEWAIQQCSIQMNGHTLKEIRALCYTTSANPDYYALLGDLKIADSGEAPTFPRSAAWSVGAESLRWSSGPARPKLLSLKITWKLKEGNGDRDFLKYNVYVERDEGKMVYVGVAHVGCFYVSDLEVASGVSAVKFVIQPCGLDGAFQNLPECPFYLLQLQGSKYWKEEEWDMRIIMVRGENKELKDGKLQNNLYLLFILNFSFLAAIYITSYLLF